MAPPGYIAKKKPVYGSGGPPCWKWLDEIWREKIERQQAIYKDMFAEYVKNRRTKVIKDSKFLFLKICLLNMFFLYTFYAVQFSSLESVI